MWQEEEIEEAKLEVCLMVHPLLFSENWKNYTLTVSKLKISVRGRVSSTST